MALTVIVLLWVFALEGTLYTSGYLIRQYGTPLALCVHNMVHTRHGFCSIFSASGQFCDLYTWNFGYHISPCLKVWAFISFPVCLTRPLNKGGKTRHLFNRPADTQHLIKITSMEILDGMNYNNRGHHVGKTVISDLQSL